MILLTELVFAVRKCGLTWGTNRREREREKLGLSKRASIRPNAYSFEYIRVWFLASCGHSLACFVDITQRHTPHNPPDAPPPLPPIPSLLCLKLHYYWQFRYWILNGTNGLNRNEITPVRQWLAYLGQGQKQFVILLYLRLRGGDRGGEGAREGREAVKKRERASERQYWGWCVCIYQLPFCPGITSSLPETWGL